MQRWVANNLYRYFYPRPPRGGRQPPISKTEGSKIFLSTPSARRATKKAIQIMMQILISIHALREEGDSCLPYPQRGPEVFLSTPSARRATRPIFARKFSHFISIHALREEGDHSLGQF